MSPAPKRAEIQALVTRFAQQSPENRQALLDDPKAVIEALTGMSLGSLTVKAIVEPADNAMVVVVPYQQAENELDPVDLDAVTGGAGSVGFIRVRIIDTHFTGQE